MTIVPSVLALPALVLLVVVAGLVGRRLAGAVLDVSDGTLTALASPLLGAGCLALVFLLTAALGVAHGWVLLFVLIGSAWSGWSAREALWCDWKQLRREVRQHAGLSGLAGAAVVVTLPFAMGPVVDWDSLSFHLRLPLEVLRSGSLALAADSLHGAQFGITHFVTLPLLALGLEAAPALFAVFTLWLCVLATGIAAGRVAGPSAARLAAVGLIASPLVLLTAMTPRVDVPLLAAISVITLAMVSDQAEGSGTRLGWLMVGCGIAAATKFHGLAFGGLAVPVILLQRMYRREMRVVWPGIILAFGIAAPWYLKNLIQYGGPLYPFGATPLLEPWLADLVGSATLPENFDTGFQSTLSRVREPFSLVAWFVSPGRLTAEAEGQWYRPSLLLLAVPLVLLTPRRRSVATALVVAVAYAVLVLMVSPSTNLRYLMPIFVPLSVAVSIGIASIAPETSTARSRLREGCIMALGMLSLVPFLWSWYPQGLRFVIAGWRDSPGAWEQSPDETVRLLGPVRELVRQHVGPGERLLMLFEARGGAFQGDVLADSRVAHWPILAQTDASSTCLGKTAITHVLINGGAINYYVRRGADPRALHLAALDRFVRECTVPVGSVNGFALLRLVPPPTGVAP